MPKRTYERVQTMDKLMEDNDQHDEEQQSRPTMEDLEYEAQMEDGQKAAVPQDKSSPKNNTMLKRQVAILHKKLEAERSSQVTKDTPIYSQAQLEAIHNKIAQKVSEDMIYVAGISAGIGIIVGFLGARYFFSTAPSHAADIAEAVS